jgi:exosortase/archaeosortase family protein
MRLALCYGIWSLFQLPALFRIHSLTGQWDIYMICLFAPLLSWHASIRCSSKLKAQKPVHGILFFASLGIMVVSFAVSQYLSTAVLLGIVGLIMLRMALAGETVQTAIFSGGILLLFMIPFSVGFYSSIADSLQQLYAAILPGIFEFLTGIPLIRYGFHLYSEWEPSVVIVRECSGIRSLFGMVLFSFYYSSIEKHPFFGFIFMSITALFLALGLNFVRILLSSVLCFADPSYWSSATGHETLGIIIVILGSILLSMIARKIVTEDIEPDIVTTSN